MVPAPHQWLNSLVCHTPPCANLIQLSTQQLSAVSNVLVAKPMMVPPPSRGPAPGRQQNYATSFSVRLFPQICRDIVCELLHPSYSSAFLWRLRDLHFLAVSEFKRLLHMQVIELDGVNAVEVHVHVKWLFGAQATLERVHLLRRATPYMLDFARQLCGADVGVCLFAASTCSWFSPRLFLLLFASRGGILQIACVPSHV